jgi:enamine deaminase RidA (YjgF/YER057c/UK114 family)
MKRFLNGALSAGVSAGILAGLLAGLLTVQIAYAQDDTSSLPAATTVGNVSYLSGGIGLDESTAMKAAASKYSLELVFSAGAAAAYIADVHVKVSDRSGKAVIDAVSNGPYLLANLPAGSYQVEASSKDVTKTQRVTVSKGSHKRLVFSWAN